MDMEFTAETSYSLWLIPDRTTTKIIREIMTALARKYNAPEFSPHCTLLGHLKNEHKEGIVSLLDELKYPIIPFEVEIVDYSDYYWKTLFLQLKHAPELMKIYELFQSRLPERISYEFDPHISLMYKILPLATLKLQSQLIDAFSGGIFDSIALFRTGDMIKSWQKIYEKKLSTI